MAQSVSAVYTDSDEGSNDEGRPGSGHHKNHSSSVAQPSRLFEGTAPLAAVASLACDSPSPILSYCLSSVGFLPSRHHQLETVASLKWELGCVASVDKYVHVCVCVCVCVCVHVCVYVYTCIVLWCSCDCCVHRSCSSQLIMH